MNKSIQVVLFWTYIQSHNLFAADCWVSPKRNPPLKPSVAPLVEEHGHARQKQGDQEGDHGGEDPGGQGGGAGVVIAVLHPPALWPIAVQAAVGVWGDNLSSESPHSASTRLAAILVWAPLSPLAVYVKWPLYSMHPWLFFYYHYLLLTEVTWMLWS